MLCIWLPVIISKRGIQKMYEIQKGIAVPEIESGPKYPFSKMEIGDSFAIHSRNVAKVKGGAYAYTKKNPSVKFSILPHDKAYRCWRVK